MARRVYDILTTLKNTTVTLTLYSDATWSLHTRTGPTARISRAYWSVHLTTPEGNPLDLYSTHSSVEQVEHQEEDTPLGPAHVLTIVHRPSKEGVRLMWKAQVLHNHPYVLMQVGVVPPGPGYRLRRLMPLAIEPPRGYILMEGLGTHWTFFLDGWHSWSFAGTLADNQRQPSSRLARFDGPVSYDIAHPPPKERGHFLAHTVGILTGRHGRTPSLLVGWARQWDYVGLVEINRNPGPDPSLWAWADGDAVPLPAETPTWSEPLLVQFTMPRDPDPMGPFAEAVGILGQARVPQEVPVGWTTWYHFFRDVTAEAVRRNALLLEDARDTLPVSLVQIDDGYEAEVGDWLQVRSLFGDTPDVLAREIRAKGFRPGLWLAPFIVSPRARVAREHPDWLLRNEEGKPVHAGFLWGTFTHALDPTHPGVQDYVREVVHTVVHEWGYTFLKLDFLYAAALPGVYHASDLTRPQALRAGLNVIREAAGEDTFLLGCGCPLGPAVGLVDAMRVGPDIAPHWYPRLYGVSRPWKKKRSYPAVINAVRNTLTRSAYHHRLWWNDPDSVIARVYDTRLSDREVQSWLSVVGLSGGLIMLGDDLDALPEERRRWVASLLPVQPEVGRPLDLLDHTVPETVALYLKRAWGKGVTVGLFNWKDEPRTRTLQLGVLGQDWHQPHHVLDFWSGLYVRVTEGYRVFTNIPPHSGYLLGVKPVLDVPHLAGSTFHISMGGEIREWSWEPPYLQFRVVLGRRSEGAVLIGTAGRRLTEVPEDVEVSTVTEDVIGLYFTVMGERTLRVRLDT